MFILILSNILLGAILGSFACCQSQRLRLKEIGKKDPGQRSVCLHCHRQLAWYDNIPIISWLMLRGRCRYCHKSIGFIEFFSEIALATLFPLLTLHYYDDITSVNPIRLLSLLVLIITITVFWILFVYDALWSRLPSHLLIAGIALALIFYALQLDYSANIPSQLLSTLAGIGLLAGLYYILYIVSHEQWVGGGDWLLALAIALLLGNWWLALLELFLANTLALIGMLIQRVTYRHRHHKKPKQTQSPLGPYLIIACFVLLLLKDQLLLSSLF